MRKLSILLLLLVPGLTQGQISVPKEHHIPNLEPGYCGWCAIETEARRLGMSQFYGLVDYRVKKNLPSGMSIEAIEYLFIKKYPVSYHMQWHGVTSTTIITDAMKADRGCIVSFDDWPVKGGRHAVLLTYYGKDQVQFVDSNSVGQATKKDRKWFDNHWNGFAMYFLE